MTVKERIFDFAKCLLVQSNGKLEIVEHEEDNSKDEQKEAATFIKLNGKRLGRDLELYSFMAKVGGIKQTLCNLLLEILIPIKDLTESYKAGSAFLQEWGEGIFEENEAIEWKGLF